MQFLIDAYEAIRDFLELGGPVLEIIGINIFVFKLSGICDTWHDN